MRSIIERKIPATMVTQHPDHASIPYWHTQAMIDTGFEVQESFLSFSELGATEYKWDWEGKLVDEAVIDRLFADHYDYFQKTKIGKDKFITFRLPNPKVETEYRLGRAFMGMLSASHLARHMGYTHHPLFEVILPMTESAEDMIAVQQAFAEMAGLKHPLLKFDDATVSHIELIPLFEQIETIASSDKILLQYISLHKKRFGYAPAYIRPYVARSDPALNSGIIPTVISIKIALSRYADFEEKYNLPLYPIIGAACLPFRGGLTPRSIESFVSEFQGIRTTTIQSAFRYDFPKEEVIAAIASLEKLLPQYRSRSVSPSEEKILRNIMKESEPMYRQVVESAAPLINAVSAFIPRRRERMQHTGLFGYSRGVGTARLPRAIGYTATLYSLGLPPEIIGTGRTIALAKKQGWLETLEAHYRCIRSDLERSMKYVNHDIVDQLAKESDGWKLYAEDLDAIESYLGQIAGPHSKEEKEHKKMTDTIISRLKDGTLSSEYIEEAALIRRSMG